MRAFILPLIGAITVWAQMSMTSDPNASAGSNYSYEERPGVGLYYEPATSHQNFIYNYQIWDKPFSLKMENSPIFGVGAHLPIYNWFGLNGVVAFQQSTFDYEILAGDSVRRYMIDSLSARLNADDLQGRMLSRNLLVQAGFEAGLPLYTNYQYQFQLKPLAYASLLGGKTFFDDSKFTNTSIWGYAYGAALRLSWGPISLEGGVRFSHIYWHTNFDPEDQTGEQAESDKFMVDYDTPLTPFAKATWALY